MTDLPIPLTPAECDLQDFAFMPLDVARLRDSELAANETPEACWAAVLLWAASWHQVPAASMPNDDRWIAKAAGYAQRGKIDKAWSSVRDGALRGWIECADGRLYHPVVAEKAREAWTAKLKQRWMTECGRIKKHNERHAGANVPKPTFEEWMAGGCIVGQPLFVPSDKPPVSPGIPPETTSKGQGEGQGQGNSYSAPNGAGGGAALNDAFAKVVGAGASIQAAGRDLSDEEEKLLWNAALALLIPSYGTGSEKTRDSKARLFVGGLGKRLKEANVERRALFDVIQAACVERPVNPESWMAAAVATRVGNRQAPNRQEAQEQRNKDAADEWAARKERELMGGASDEVR